jgi:hypothetical protein
VIVSVGVVANGKNACHCAMVWLVVAGSTTHVQVWTSVNMVPDLDSVQIARYVANSQYVDTIFMSPRHDHAGSHLHRDANMPRS